MGDDHYRIQHFELNLIFVFYEPSINNPLRTEEPKAKASHFSLQDRVRSSV